jgi:hypothetical protein
MSELFGPIVPLLLIALIMGLVQGVKAIWPGIQGKWCITISMGLGLLLGMLYQAAMLAPGTAIGFRLVFEFVVYSLLLGLAASGFYDLTKRSKPEG